MKNPYIRLLFKSWHYAQEKRSYFALAITFFVVSMLFDLLKPYVFGQILNTLQKSGPTLWQDFVFYLLCYVSIPLVFWIFHGIWRICERIAAFYIGKNFKIHVFGIITELPFAWHTDNHSWETINKVNKAAWALEGFGGDNYMYVQTVVRFFGSLVGIAMVSVYACFAAAIAGIAIAGIVLLFDKKITPQYAQILEKEHRVASLLHDYVSNIRTVITLHFENLAKSELLSKIMDTLPVKRKNFILNEWKWFTVEMLISLGIFGVLLGYGYFSLRKSGAILAGNLVILYQYLESFSWTFYNFAWGYEKIVKMDSEFQTIDPILEKHGNLVRNSDTFEFGNWKTIELENWNFWYAEDKGKHTLKNVSMEIKKGERIAFIGESGSGKSTMASLIKWLYQAEGGTLRIDGKKAKNPGILSRITTLIPQDPEIFENTLEYNITFGIETAPEHIAQATRLARFDSVLNRLPKGLETNIKEKWVNLSGWEKQRLALARGLFMGRLRDIIIMDEPTSSVDPINETAIYKNIFSEFEEKSVISAVHKLHLLPLFDTLYLFDHGEIIERGTFDELVLGNGKFAKLWHEYVESSGKGKHVG